MVKLNVFYCSVLALAMSGCALFPSGGLVRHDAPAVAAQSLNSTVAQDIIRKVDEVKSPQGDYTLSVEVSSYNKGKEPKSATYEVLIKGNDNTIIKTIKPENERGRVILMKERNLWAFFPAVRKPIRLSMQERLIGEVSNGDIARTNFSGDYDASLLRTEKIGGKEYYVLELKAVSPEVTYGKAVVWAQKSNFRPLRAEFFAISGKLLKTCSYEAYASFGDRVRPTKLVMEDPVFAGKKSVITYSHLKAGALPEKYFTKDYMKKIME